MLNECVIMGRLTADPELKSTQGGTSVCSFTLACDRDYKPKDATEKEVDWIDCVAWRHTAEFISKYFAKGRAMVAKGRLQTRTWEDQDGKKRKSTELVIEQAYFGDSKQNAPEGFAPAGFDDDPPF